MKPTKTRGVCGHCHEPNSYTEINCVRCTARLAWAFLIDGKENTPNDLPIERFFSQLLGAPEIESRKIRCRFCDKSIVFDEKICPHCKNFLASADFSRWGGWPLVDPDAPEIKRLVAQDRKQKQVKNAAIDITAT